MMGLRYARGTFYCTRTTYAEDEEPSNGFRSSWGFVFLFREAKG